MSKESELRERIEDMKKDMEGIHEVNNDFFNENEILKARCETLERVIVKLSARLTGEQL